MSAWEPGTVVGRWTVTGERQHDRRGKICIPVRCECGTERIVRLDRLTNGRSRSCGCLMRDLKTQQMTRHGWTRTPEYQAWADMIRRCENPKAPRYEHYGARGITVCRRWRADFLAFLGDMGPRPQGMTLDRIDVNGHYDPANCRWATYSQQNANLRPRDKCRNGHLYSPANTRWRTKGGGRVRQCITCADATKGAVA